MHCSQNPKNSAKFTREMQLKLTKWRPFSWHLYKRLNCDHWKIFVTIDKAMFNLGGSYSRRRVCYIRNEHGDPSQLKCVKSDSLHQVSWPRL